MNKYPLLSKISLFIIIIHGLALFGSLWVSIGSGVARDVAAFLMSCVPLAVLLCIYGVLKVRHWFGGVVLGVAMIWALFWSSFIIANVMTGGSCNVDDTGVGRCFMPIAEVLLGFIIGAVSTVPLVMTYHKRRLSGSVRLLEWAVVALITLVMYLLYWAVCDTLRYY